LYKKMSANYAKPFKTKPFKTAGLPGMLKSILTGEKGESPLTFPVLILITVMVLYMGVDILGIYSTNQKLRAAASETLTLIKMENGWDSDTQQFFDDMLRKAGLSPGTVTVHYATPKNQSPPVQRGDTVVLEVSTSYEVRSLKPLGTTISAPVRVRLSGLAQEFVRQQ